MLVRVRFESCTLDFGQLERIHNNMRTARILLAIYQGLEQAKELIQ